MLKCSCSWNRHNILLAHQKNIFCTFVIETIYNVQESALYGFCYLRYLVALIGVCFDPNVIYESVLEKRPIGHMYHKRRNIMTLHDVAYMEMGVYRHRWSMTTRLI